jgi:glutathione S-transferase
MHANFFFSSQVHDFQKEIKTYLGKDGAPGDAPAIVAKWFALFQAILERNDDNDIQTDEYMYGKVSISRS